MDIPSEFVGAVVQATTGETIKGHFMDATSNGGTVVEDDPQDEEDSQMEEEVKKEDKPLTRAWCVLPIPDELKQTMQ